MRRLVLLLCLIPSACFADDDGEWIQLFNGKDLTGWIPKIRYHEAGDNFANTFRVVDGLLTVSYDGYDKYDERFGHLFYEKPFSNYLMRVEYRFVGEQCPGGPGWAIRNSGVMVHGESPMTMAKDQDFPASIEVQLLGGNGKDPRTTANLCTPGTNVEMNGELILRHCTSSTSKTYHGDQWVTWLLLDVDLGGRGRLDYCNLRPFALIDRSILVLYGPEKSPAHLSINESAMETTVPTGAKPRVIRHGDMTVVICNEQQIDATYIASSRVYVGADGLDASGQPLPKPGFTHITVIGGQGEETQTQRAAPIVKAPPTSNSGLLKSSTPPASGPK